MTDKALSLVRLCSKKKKNSQKYHSSLQRQSVWMGRQLASWVLEIFWWQAQLEGDRATTAIWELEIFWLQAQLELGEKAITAIWELEIFWWQAQLEGDRATTAIWELEIFWWQAQLEGDRATTAIWELEVFFGGRPSWKATGLQLQFRTPLAQAALVQV